MRLSGTPATIVSAFCVQRSSFVSRFFSGRAISQPRHALSGFLQHSREPPIFAFSPDSHDARRHGHEEPLFFAGCLVTQCRIDAEPISNSISTTFRLYHSQSAASIAAIRHFAAIRFSEVAAFRAPQQEPRQASLPELMRRHKRMVSANMQPRYALLAELAQP